MIPSMHSVNGFNGLNDVSSRSRRASSQLQMNIATACLSARYTEIARKTGREVSMRPTTSSFPRKGSPASRPKKSVTLNEEHMSSTRTPSPSGGMSAYGSVPRTGSPYRSAATSRRRVASVGSETPSARGTTPVSALGYSSADSRMPILTHSLSPRSSARRSFTSMPPRSTAAATFQATTGSPMGVSAFDYLNKAGAEMVVSPLVKSLNQHLGMMEEQITDSLQRSRTDSSGGSPALRAMTPSASYASPAFPPKLTPPASSLRASLRAQALEQHFNPVPSQSQRFVSPPRTATRPSKMELLLKKEVETSDESLEVTLLQTELGRVRQGLGASVDPLTKDWAWPDGSLAGVVADAFVEMHEEQCSFELDSLRGSMEIAYKSCSVYRATALMRDLSVTEEHTRGMADVAEENRRLKEELRAERVQKQAVYTMTHASIAETEFVVYPDGAHSSEVGRGSWVLTPEDNGELSLLLSWEDQGDDVVLTSRDQGRFWKGLPGTDTIELKLKPAADLPQWLRAEALAASLAHAHRHKADTAAKERELRAEVGRLRDLLLPAAQSDCSPASPPAHQPRRPPSPDSSSPSQSTAAHTNPPTNPLATAEHRSLTPDTTNPSVPRTEATPDWSGYRNPLSEDPHQLFEAALRSQEHQHKEHLEKVRRDAQAAVAREREKRKQQQLREVEKRHERERREIERLKAAEAARAREQRRFEVDDRGRDDVFKREEMEREVRNARESQRRAELEAREEKRLLEEEQRHSPWGGGGGSSSSKAAAAGAGSVPPFYRYLRDEKPGGGSPAAAAVDPVPPPSIHLAPPLRDAFGSLSSHHTDGADFQPD
ncbi:Reticulocyte-binding protein 2-like protein a [Diplonema papillatum]|nr:Reticulocyte-binding protein 2-like protein a [Diplonema papillatum]